MSREEIEDAQTPSSGWATETRAFTGGGVDSPPKWRDFNDPLEAISAIMPLTTQNVMVDDSRQAGAIEITPEMIEAGISALVDHEHSSPAFLAELIFRAMQMAQFEKPCQFHS